MATLTVMVASAFAFIAGTLTALFYAVQLAFEASLNEIENEYGWLHLVSIFLFVCGCYTWYKAIDKAKIIDKENKTDTYDTQIYLYHTLIELQNTNNQTDKEKLRNVLERIERKLPE